MKTYSVYILANATRMLYTGMTSNLERRIYEHKQKLIPGFTAHYNITRLVHVEQTSDAHAAVERERQIKRWSRYKKVELIERENPGWEDLAAPWVRGGGTGPPDMTRRPGR